MSSTGVKVKTKPSERLAALDGLRGLAALIVLAHHAMYTDAAFPGTPGAGNVQTGSPMWWISYTPLKLATAGWESVIVFFVLSGLVVSLPVVRKRGFDWVAYFPRRVVRLMVPVMGAVVVAAAFVIAIPQRSVQPSGTWLSNPLWSLRWELVFSLALPVIAIAAIAVRKWWMAGLATAVVLTWLGVRTGSGALSYLPAFFVGAVLAVRLDAVRLFAGRLNARRLRHPLWFLIAAGGSMLMIAPWLLGQGAGDARELVAVLKGFAPLGAAAIVVAAIGWKPLHLLFESRPLQFAGAISFSLYLVHVPILIFSSYLFAGQPWFVPLLFAIPVAILVAVGFTWLVEKRSHAWSRSAGAWASARYNAWFGREEIAEDARPNADASTDRERVSAER
jgi:peptidoglycan/LPS O-acetylase OafA/YrhL